MTKKQAKEIARNELQKIFSTAYYKITDNDEYSQKEAEIIIAYMDKDIERMIKLIDREYYTM